MLRILAPAALLACAAIAPHATAQNYPTKAVRIIAPFAPGGGTDFIARVAANKLTETLGHTVIVDNRPGAGGTLGAEIGAKSPADGYTLTLVAGSYSVNPSLYKINFDPVNDITPIIQLSQGPFLVVVHPALPVKTIKDLIAIGKRKSGGLIYASSGAGSITQLATELFDDMAEVHVGDEASEDHDDGPQRERRHPGDLGTGR